MSKNNREEFEYRYNQPIFKEKNPKTLSDFDYENERRDRLKAIREARIAERESRKANSSD